MLPPDLIGSTEAAEIIGWSRSHFNRRVADGTVPVVHEQPGRTGIRLFDRSTIEALAAELKQVAS